MKQLVAVVFTAMFAGLAMGAEAPAAAEPVSILAPVTYAVEAPVPERVRQECHIESQVLDDLHETLAGKGMGGTVVASAGDGLVLKVTIERVIGQPGGGWSGQKSLTLGIALLRAGSVERTTSLSYATKSLNPLARTCASFERASSKLSEVVAKWLASDRLASKTAGAKPSPAPAASTSSN